MAEADDTHEGTPNPALGPPKDVETDFSDAELAGPNPALGPPDRILHWALPRT